MYYGLAAVFIGGKQVVGYPLHNRASPFPDARPDCARVYSTRLHIMPLGEAPIALRCLVMLPSYAAVALVML